MSENLKQLHFMETLIKVWGKTRKYIEKNQSRTMEKASGKVLSLICPRISKEASVAEGRVWKARILQS